MQGQTPAQPKVRTSEPSPAVLHHMHALATTNYFRGQCCICWGLYAVLVGVCVAYRQKERGNGAIWTNTHCNLNENKTGTTGVTNMQA